ncbi:MAG TPA: glycoside hydrolase family 3 protein, partial [Longimicrobiaceae bacterium]|nr:glycoside hydrolase family 3 protein [Longimicrobiaceae bacterium]
AAQVVLPWISGQSASENPEEWQRMLQWVERDQVGGLIVSTGAPRVLLAKLNAAQARARVPLLVVSDLETGPGMRLRPGGTDFPPAMAFGAAGSEALARQAGRVTAAEARAVGIHLTLGPVLDLNSNPDNPIINVRSFGEDPARVGRLAAAWIAGAREGGLLAAGKHFPGHGDTRVDSHVGLATVRGDSARLATTELVPFRAAVDAGIEGMLVGHLAVLGIEGPGAGPASLSPRVIGGLLRERLRFEGLVITDALNMGAITGRYPVPAASVRALQAGADLLLQPPGHPEVIDSVAEAVRSGRLAPARLDQAVRRVLEAKARAGIHRGAAVAGDSLAARVGVPAHAAEARRVAAASITLARDRTGLVPRTRPAGRVLHVSYGEAGGAFTAELTAAGWRVEHARVSARTGAAEFARLRARAAEAELVVASAFVAPHQYRALGLAGGFAAFVEGLAAAGRPVVAVSFGSPYLLAGFPSVPAYLLAWSGSEASQRAAARALAGLAPITGRLPVSLPPFHDAGEGVRRPG